MDWTGRPAPRTGLSESARDACGPVSAFARLAGLADLLALRAVSLGNRLAMVILARFRPTFLDKMSDMSVSCKAPCERITDQES